MFKYIAFYTLNEHTTFEKNAGNLSTNYRGISKKTVFMAAGTLNA
jgi:hypothetical protein